MGINYEEKGQTDPWDGYSILRNWRNHPDLRRQYPTREKFIHAIHATESASEITSQILSLLQIWDERYH